MGTVAEAAQRLVGSTHHLKAGKISTRDLYRMRGQGERRWVGRNALAQVVGRHAVSLLKGERPKGLDDALSDICFRLREAHSWDGGDRALLNRFQAGALLTAVSSQSPLWCAILRSYPILCDCCLVTDALTLLYPL